MFVVSLLIYGLLQTEFLGGQLRQARAPLTILLSVPGVLIFAYIIIEQVYNSLSSQDEFSDSEGEEEEEGTDDEG